MSASVISPYIRGVRYRRPLQERPHSQMKRFVTDMFRLDILVPDNIADDAPLTGGAFDLDSFDMLELALCVEEAFGIAIRSEEEARNAFRSIASLVDFIHAQAQIGQERQLSAVEDSTSVSESRLPAGPFARG